MNHTRQDERGSALGPTVDDLSDDMLLAGLGVGDPDTARAFVRRFQGIVFGVALTTIGDPSLAEEVAQQAFVHAWRHAELYDPRRGSVRSWLRGIAHNLAVDAVRVRRPVPIDEHELELLLDPAVDDPERQVLAAEAVGELRRALVSLPPEQAKAVVLAAVHGLTAAQIAHREGIPLGTAKSRIRAAMIELHARTARQRDRHG
jgi:RNA polymerase sigma factor (sigma-70 family)